MKFKEAMHYRKLNDKKLHCILCPHNCFIENGEVGKCLVRMNVNGSLKTLFYSKPFITKYRPIEKFNLYHILPGKETFSIGVAGNNLISKNSQNENLENISNIEQTPSQILKQVKKTKCKSIVYNYAEPFVNYEYIKNIAEKSKELKHILVTNGFINHNPLVEIDYLIDAVNIEIKSLDSSFYEEIYSAKLEAILKAVKTMHEHDIWIEISTKVIPKFHDNLYDIRRLISFILDNFGSDIPLHLINYNDNTNPEILKKARRIAMQAGMNYVYTDDLNWEEGCTTFCPNCKKAVIIRNKEGVENKIFNGRCTCGKKIPGIWE